LENLKLDNFNFNRKRKRAFWNRYKKVWKRVKRDSF